METEAPLTVGKSLNYFEQIRKNWFLFAFVASVIMGYSQIKNDIQNLEVRSTKIELKADGYEKDVQGLQNDISSIKTSLEFIKDKLK